MRKEAQKQAKGYRAARVTATEGSGTLADVEEIISRQTGTNSQCLLLESRLHARYNS